MFMAAVLISPSLPSQEHYVLNTLTRFERRFFGHYFQVLTWKTVPNVEKQTKMNTQPLPPIQTTQLLDLLVSFLCPVAIAVRTYVALSCCGLPQVACRIASCDFQKTEKGADQTFSQCCFITLASSCPQRKRWSRNSIAAIPSVLIPCMPTTAWKGPGAPDELSETQGSHLWTCVSPTSGLRSPLPIWRWSRKRGRCQHSCSDRHKPLYRQGKEGKQLILGKWALCVIMRVVYHGFVLGYLLSSASEGGIKNNYYGNIFLNA